MHVPAAVVQTPLPGALSTASAVESTVNVAAYVFEVHNEVHSEVHNTAGRRNRAVFIVPQEFMISDGLPQQLCAVDRVNSGGGRFQE